MERADAANAQRGPRARRAAVVDGDTGDPAVQALQHAGRGLLVGALQVDTRDGAGDVRATLLLVARDHDLFQHRGRLLQPHVDGGLAVHGHVHAPIADHGNRQHGIGGRDQTEASLLVGDGLRLGAFHPHRRTPQLVLGCCGRDGTRDQRPLSHSGPTDRHQEHDTNPNCTKESLHGIQSPEPMGAVQKSNP